ncbi:hypothetical protein [Serratia grimesii]|uniref:hypothetical protein n=1 Tax=Serratia grimesii TaxID=82995 RepID=UPI00223FAEBA|nr:hypothetical protein [Serratia grimesii]
MENQHACESAAKTLNSAGERGILLAEWQKAKSPLIAERAFLNMVAERELRASSMLALRANAKALFKTVPDSFASSHKLQA